MLDVRRAYAEGVLHALRERGRLKRRIRTVTTEDFKKAYRFSPTEALPFGDRWRVKIHYDGKPVADVTESDKSTCEENANRICDGINSASKTFDDSHIDGFRWLI